MAYRDVSLSLKLFLNNYSKKNTIISTTNTIMFEECILESEIIDIKNPYKIEYYDNGDIKPFIIIENIGATGIPAGAGASYDNQFYTIGINCIESVQIKAAKLANGIEKLLNYTAFELYDIYTTIIHEKEIYENRVPSGIFCQCNRNIRKTINNNYGGINVKLIVELESFSN